MAATLGQLKFFKQRSLKEKQMNDLIGAMSLMEAPSQKVLFRYGEMGDSFYVILQGQVSVYVPCDFATAENALEQINQLILCPD